MINKVDRVNGDQASSPEDKQLKGPIDRSRVNVWEWSDVLYWAEYFRIAPEQLEDAVKRVGSRIEDVEAFIER